MVSTRSHPEPLESLPTTPSKALATTTPSRSRRKRAGWTYTPTPLTLVWLLFSLPLVIWDTAYVLLQPYTFPGGALHSPVFVPYALYGEVDLVYGREAFETGIGFTRAQGTLNLLETMGYLGYLYVVYKHGEGIGAERDAGILGQAIHKMGFGGNVGGGWGGMACLFGFALSVMTLSKTILYGLNESYSGFHHIGHNDPFTLLMCWIIPNGLWILLPLYMCFVLATDILDGLAIASGDSSSKPAQTAAAIKEA